MPTPPGTLAIRPLDARDVNTAGGILGRAFVDNPGYARPLDYMSAEQRARAVARFKTALAHRAVRSWTADGLWLDGALVSAMLVMTPGQYPMGLRAELGLAPVVLPWGPRGVKRLIVLDQWLQRHHPRIPHHYLFVLGVEPHLQGRGLGRAMLEHLCARAGELPCYLETDKESSVRLYRSAGFDVVRDEVIPGANHLRMWSMQRPGRKTAAQDGAGNPPATQAPAT